MPYKAPTLTEAVVDCFRRGYVNGHIKMSSLEVAEKVSGLYVLRHEISVKHVEKVFRHLRTKKVLRRDDSFLHWLSNQEIEKKSEWIFTEELDARNVSSVSLATHSRTRIGHPNGYQIIGNTIYTSAGFIYFVQWEDMPQFVKIGFSLNPSSRLNGFLTSCPSTLRVLAIEPVNCNFYDKGEEYEATLHRRFKKYKHKREWFLYSGELKRYINQLDTCPAIKMLDKNSNVAKGDIVIEYF